MPRLSDVPGVSDLGAYLREQRENAQLSVRQLSRVSGISNPYLSQIERGLRRPSAEILNALAKGLEVSAESLYVRAGLLEDPATRRDAADEPGRAVGDGAFGPAGASREGGSRPPARTPGIAVPPAPGRAARTVRRDRPDEASAVRRAASNTRGADRPAVDARAALTADPRLTAPQRRALLDLYDQFVEANPAGDTASTRQTTRTTANRG